jgi:hypothetical protein
MKITCPNCKSEIVDQAEIGIPVSKIGTSDETQATLMIKNGKLFIILQAVVDCPSCGDPFGLDVFLPAELADQS